MRNYLLPVMMFILVLMLAGAVSAQSMLDITDITVKVNGDRQSADENGGTIDVPPDSTLDLKIKIENLFDKDIDDIEIENVEIEAILEDIDDGDDMDETSDDKDISAGRDETFNIEFKIPLRIDGSETYTLTVTATGEDTEGEEHTAEVVFDVEADKENHELRFLRREVSPTKVSCSRTATLRVDMINTGDNDEDVEFSIQNSALDYLVERDFEMVEDIDDDDNEYSFSDTLSLQSAAIGVYPFKILAKYRDGRETLEETLTIAVEECATDKPAPKPEPKPEPKVEPKVEPKEEPKTTTTTTQPTVVYYPSTQPSNTVTSQPPVNTKNTAVATPKTSYGSGSWWERNKWLAIILITDVILLIIGIAIVLAVMKRKRS